MATATSATSTVPDQQTRARRCGPGARRCATRCGSGTRTSPISAMARVALEEQEHPDQGEQDEHRHAGQQGDPVEGPVGPARLVVHHRCGAPGSTTRDVDRVPVRPSGGDGDSVVGHALACWQQPVNEEPAPGEQRVTPGRTSRSPVEPVCQDAGMQRALDALIALLDLEPIEVNIFRGTQPRRGRPAGVRWPGGRPGPGGRGPNGRAGSPRPLAARLLPATRRPDRAHPLRGRPHPRRPLVHHPTGGGHPARSGHLQPADLVPRPRDGLRPRGGHARRRAPAPRRCPTSRQRWAPWAEVMGEWYDRAAAHRQPRTCDWEPLDRSRAAAAAPTGVAARRRRACPTTRCCTPAS